MMQVIHSRFNALLSASVLSLVATVAWSQSLTWLGVLPGDNQSAATGVSADGSVVVGTSTDSVGSSRAFRWTASGGMQNLGTLGGNENMAFGVSADGAVVVGYTRNAAAGRERAFRWTVDGGMQDLGTLGGQNGRAFAISANGAVVVGGANNAAGQWRAFRWTVDGVMQGLGTLPGGGLSEAWNVSADGAVVVGTAHNAAGRPRAFRWTASGGMQDLGTLGGERSGAYGVSATGAVVVGSAHNAAGRERAFRWTVDGGMQDLGTLPGGRSSYARDVSADGSVVVGAADLPSGLFSQQRAVRWTASGIEDLNTTYASLLTNGSRLEVAIAISPDGRYIVGAGYNAATGGRREAFLLDTRCTLNGDVNGDGVVDDADLLIVLFNFGSRCR